MLVGGDRVLAADKGAPFGLALVGPPSAAHPASLGVGPPSAAHPASLGGHAMRKGLRTRSAGLRSKSEVDERALTVEVGDEPRHLAGA